MLSKTLVAIAIAGIVALLPPPFFCTPKYARGILIDAYGRALTVPGDSFTNGVRYKADYYFDRTNPAIYINTGEWQLDSVLAANSSFNIKTMFNGKCVTAASGGSVIDQQDCNGGNNQNWRFFSDSSFAANLYDGFRVVNMATGQCLGFAARGGTTIYQASCGLFFLQITSWTIEQFAVVPALQAPGVLRSVSAPGKCLARNAKGEYFLQLCDGGVKAQHQNIWMWDSIASRSVGDQWNNPVTPRMCTTTSPTDYTKIYETSCPSNHIIPDEMKWQNIGNVEYKFQIKNIKGGNCLDAGTSGLVMHYPPKLTACSATTDTMLWIRSQASFYMKGYAGVCYQPDDCLSGKCFKYFFSSNPFTAGGCMLSQNGQGCRGDNDCDNGKCRSGQCACITYAETTGPKGLQCGLDSHCCSGKCGNTDGIGKCGCHAFAQPCDSDSECCSLSCDPLNKVCKCIKAGIIPPPIFTDPNVGHGIMEAAKLCCSGLLNPDSNNACATGELGAYCEANSECMSGTVCIDHACHCSSNPNGNCTDGGNDFCKTCNGKGSVCYKNQCCYRGGVTVVCEGGACSDGGADNGACCSGRCQKSGTSCASGRDESFCSSGGPSCTESDNEYYAESEGPNHNNPPQWP